MGSRISGPTGKLLNVISALYIWQFHLQISVNTPEFLCIVTTPSIGGVEFDLVLASQLLRSGVTDCLLYVVVWVAKTTTPWYIFID